MSEAPFTPLTPTLSQGEREKVGAARDFRGTHLGHWMGQALQRFDARVLSLMSRNEEVPLGLSNLAARGASERFPHSHHTPSGAGGLASDRAGPARQHEQTGHGQAGRAM